MGWRVVKENEVLRFGMDLPDDQCCLRKQVAFCHNISTLPERLLAGKSVPDSDSPHLYNFDYCIFQMQSQEMVESASSDG
jgi:hypothetical protein